MRPPPPWPSPRALWACRIRRYALQTAEGGGKGEVSSYVFRDKRERTVKLT